MQLTGKRSLAAILAVLAGALVYLAQPGLARAYPQFQFRTYNTRCDMCHYSPAGGGLINGFGRDESSDTISSRSGQGGFLHGQWAPPKWLQIGGDLRGAGIVKKTEDRTELLGFPMQADMYFRVAGGPVSLNATVGMRGAAREPRSGIAERVFSREHYLMWQQPASGLYARAGRFFAPYGLRLADHTAYIRRHLGMYALEETYNLSLGKLTDQWEAHATVFVPAPIPILGVGPRATGAALYYERRAREDTAAIGLQSRVAVSPDDARYWLGGVGKLWLEDLKLLVLSELDLGLQTFAGAGDPRVQLIGYLGASYLWRQGWLVGTSVQHYNPDLTLESTARNALALTVQYFPLAHIELMLVGKYEVAGRFDSSNPIGMLMFHYYL